MRWPDALRPVRMTRVAIVAPQDGLRAALVEVADSGTVELDEPDAVDDARGSTPGRANGVTPRLLSTPVDPGALDAAGRTDLLAGEAQLRRHASAAAHHDGVAALTGWCPAEEMGPLTGRLVPHGAALVPLPTPPGVAPPTLLRDTRTLRRSFAPLVRAYGTVAYPDIDPTLLAGLAYVVMFGMMFADAGHGLALLGFAALLRAGRPRRLARLREQWPFVAGAGLASTAFGLLFGEFFGPTSLVPIRWLDPLEEPVRLLAAGVGLGAVLLAGAYAVAVVNRWREGSAQLALYAPSGIAGAALFAGFGTLAVGVYLGAAVLTAAGVVVALAGLVLAGIGLYAASGGGPTGAVETAVHLFDLLVRLGANLASFARLAAFGLTHAALGALVWSATSGLWAAGGVAYLAAGLTFIAGNALTFCLEALVAGVQALRLEYYELFSRVFLTEGRPFRPWHIPVVTEEVRS